MPRTRESGKKSAVVSSLLSLCAVYAAAGRVALARERAGRGGGRCTVTVRRILDGRVICSETEHGVGGEEEESPFELKDSISTFENTREATLAVQA